MGSIPVANPAPIRRPHGARAALISLALVAATVAVSAVLVAVAWPEHGAGGPRWEELAVLSDLKVAEPLLIKEHDLYIVRLNDYEVVALSRVSTHLGCKVPWRPQFQYNGRKGWFRDPCSGTTWDLDGSLVPGTGPAPRSLAYYPVQIRDRRVFVDTGTLMCGDTHLPRGNGRVC